jgi:hypothetical protein
MDFNVGYGGLGIAVIVIGVILWSCSGKLDEMERAE